MIITDCKPEHEKKLIELIPECSKYYIMDACNSKTNVCIRNNIPNTMTRKDRYGYCNLKYYERNFPDAQFITADEFIASKGGSMSKFKVGQRWTTRDDRCTFVITAITNTNIIGDKFYKNGAIAHRQAIRNINGVIYDWTEDCDDLYKLISDVKENDMKTKDGFEIKLNDIVYDRDGNKIKVLGFDSVKNGPCIIYRGSTGCLCCCHFTSEFTHYPPKPEGFEVIITSHNLGADYHAIYFNESFICKEYQEKIEALKGHRIKVTVEVL